MKSHWRLLLALFGTILLVAMLRVIGVDVVIAGLRRAGWVTVPILVLQGITYALNAWSWWITMPPDVTRPRYREVLRISVIGFAMNFVTPIVNAGGEPYRIAALTPRFGIRRATGSVLLYVMVHAVSSLLLWLAAIALVLAILPHAGLTTGALTLGLVLAITALGVVLSGHRNGVVVRLASLLSRLRLRRLSDWLAARHESLRAVDAEIIGLWHERPRQFVGAITVDFLSRLTAALEFVLIAFALGLPLHPGIALAMWGLLALAMNLFFIFPWELGSRESSIYAVSQLAGMPVAFAGLAVVVGRLRELTWAVLGMTLLWLDRPDSSPR